MEFFVHNRCSLIPDNEGQRAVAAIQKQVALHVLPHWSASSILHFISSTETPPEDASVFALQDFCDLQGALAYHTINGVMPMGIIGVKTCLRDGFPWQVGLSHEVIEATVDPECVRLFQIDDLVVPLEPGDPPEGLSYDVDGVQVADFCLPSYYLRAKDGPYSFTGKLAGPFPALASAGYFLSAKVGDFVQDSAGFIRESKRTAGFGSRRARRMERR